MNTIGKYRILSKIGQGGMGVVYKALDPKIDRVLAIKTISARLDEEPDLQERFRREASSAARLSHKNIITIYDYDEEEGLAYLAMEFLQGEDLKSKIRSRADLTLKEKLRIMTEICEGLSHAHKMGIVHRDVKPGNIFITEAGEVKILDFGLARLASSELTRTGVSMGTPAYMSPEQLRSEMVDFRSDIFSAGVLFYELLTYRRPFPGDSDFAISIKILQYDPDPMEIHDSSIPPGIPAIVLKALEKDPARRYKDMDEVLAALKNVRRSLEPMQHKEGQAPQPAPEAPIQEIEAGGRTEFLTPPQRPMPGAPGRSPAGAQRPEPAAASRPRPAIGVGLGSIAPTSRARRTSGNRKFLFGGTVLLAVVLAAAFYWFRQRPADQPTEDPETTADVALSEEKAVEPPAPEPAPTEAEQALEASPDDARVQPPREEISGLDESGRTEAGGLLKDMEQAKSAAQSARAPILAGSIFDEALKLEYQARQALQDQDYTAAGGNFKRAADLYRRAEIDARTTTARLAEEKRKRDLAERIGARAFALFKQGRYQDSRETTESWIAGDPENVQALQLRSRTAALINEMGSFRRAVDNRRYDDARRALENIAKLNPDDPNLSALQRRLPVEALRGPRAAPTLLRDAPARKDPSPESRVFPIQAGPAAERVRGKLSVDRATIEFRSEVPDRGFRFPLEKVDLRTDTNRILVIDRDNGETVAILWARDASEAEIIKEAADAVRP